MDNQDLVSSPKNRFSWKRFFSVAVPVVIVLLAGGIVLVRHLGERKLEKAAEQAALDRERYVRVLDERAVAMQRADIRLFSVPLAWSVRRELMQQNYAQIDEYFSELVRNRQFRVVMLVDHAGKIKVSSDRKLLGNAFSSLYPGIGTTPREIVSYPLPGNSSDLFLVPVLGLNAGIGTVAFVYSYDRLSENL